VRGHRHQPPQRRTSGGALPTSGEAQCAPCGGRHQLVQGADRVGWGLGPGELDVDRADEEHAEGSFAAVDHRGGGLGHRRQITGDAGRLARGHVRAGGGLAEAAVFKEGRHPPPERA